MVSFIRVFVYLSHTLFWVFSFLPDTKIHDTLFNGQFKLFIYFTISFLFVIYFYKRATGSPFYVTEDEAQLDNSENLFYCQICQHYCPIRAVHCKKCKKCVLRKDHHCPFLDGCVGMGNHFFFLLFLISLLFYDSLTIYIFKDSMKDDQELDEWLITSLPCNIAYFGAMMSIFQPLFLVPMHLYFAFTNQTTWEVMKGNTAYLNNWHNLMGPFSRGLINNFIEFCTMHIKRPSYKIPTSEEELARWKSDNSFLTNDKYDCC